MDADDVAALGEELDALESKLDGGQAVVGRFSDELTELEGRMRGASREVSGLSRRLGSSLRRAFDGVAFDGRSPSEALGGLARSVLDQAYGRAVAPVQGALGGALGRLMPFAQGGVVSQPTAFPMRGGTGLMGEAGPEAILPLRRGSDGRLGVETSGGGGTVNVTMNVATPDVASFRRSRSQIAAEMGRALTRGARNR